MFTKQDLLTFVLGALAGVVIEVQPIINAALQPDAAVDADALLKSIGAGVLAALARYLATRIPELMAKMRPAA